MMLFESFKNQIIEHAEEVFPNECLGVILGDKYVRLENVSPMPDQNFEMSEEDERKYVFPDDMTTRCKAVVHSHPDGPLCPSAPDMTAQIEGEIPFCMVAHSEETGWIYWEMGDHMLDEPLLERPWMPGVFDCYGDVRAWFWQTYGIFLKDWPRREEWWMPGEDGEPADNLYGDHFEEAGFRQLTEEEIRSLRKGDCFMFKLNPATAEVSANMIETHGGVYIGDGRIFHHLPRRLSTEDNAEQWGKKASRWFRYVGEGCEKMEDAE
jgi:proteasome lid subunit RPN8/RPN11